MGHGSAVVWLVTRGELDRGVAVASDAVTAAVARAADVWRGGPAPGPGAPIVAPPERPPEPTPAPVPETPDPEPDKGDD